MMFGRKRARALLGALGLLAATPGVASAETVFQPIRTQYIAALAAPDAKSGTGAENWGLWRQDPGPRGVWLSHYDALKAAGGVAPANWRFDEQDWWLEEHGLIMEPPEFSLPPGRYVVTGDREVSAVLTVHPADADGAKRWELDGGASIYDVTHLQCRSARYAPRTPTQPCSPANAPQSAFPIYEGAAMPPVEGCRKQDYAVLFVVGMAVEQ